MIWKVVYTGQAEQDLRGIYEYIAFTLLEPEVAMRQVKRIMDSIAKLSHTPMRHRLLDKEPWRSKGLRISQTDNYLAFYLPVEAQATVAVIRIMYGGRDILEQLSESVINSGERMPGER